MIKLIFSLSIILKLILIFLLPLQLDEVYYFFWSQHLQWGYFDHPPMIAYMMWPSAGFKLVHPHLIRIPALLVSHLTVYTWLRIAQRFFPKINQPLMIALMLFSPLLGLGGIVSTPDIPLLFFFSLAFYFFLKCLSNPDKINYSLFGFILGLSFLSKYTAVLFVPWALLYIIISGQINRIQWKLLPLTITGGLLACLPVLLWNQQNEWASFLFQIGHGLNGNASQISIKKYLLEQLLLISPFILLSAASLKKNRLALALFGFGPLFFFLLSSFKARAEANWPLVAYPFIYASASQVLDGLHKRVRANFLLWGTATALFATVLAFNLYSVNKTKLYDFEKYNSIAPQIANYRPLFASTYQMASALSFLRKDDVFKLFGSSRKDTFDFFPQAKPLKSFYLIKKKDENLPEWISSEKKHSTEVLLELPMGTHLLKVDKL